MTCETNYMQQIMVY